MATASAIITQCRLRLGDTNGDYLTTDRGLAWLDEATNGFLEVLLSLKRTKSFTVAAGQETFSLPDELIGPVEVVTSTRYTRHQLKYMIPVEFERLKTTNRITSDYPEYWTFKDNRLYIWPFFNTASKTVLVNASTTTTDTTIVLASTANLRDYGRAIFGTQEEVEYTTRGSLSISVVTRAQGGTVASTHASAATGTQTDLEIQYPRKASALASTATPDTPSWTHQKLQNYVLYLAELSRGNLPKADYYLQLWNKDLEDAKYSIMRKQNQSPMRVIDVDHYNRYRRDY